MCYPLQPFECGDTPKSMINIGFKAISMIPIIMVMNIILIATALPCPLVLASQH